MAKHKSEIHMPPAPAAPAPRLFAQLLVALGELVVAGIFLRGLVTIGAWLLAGYDTFARMAARLDRPAPPPGIGCTAGAIDTALRFAARRIAGRRCGATMPGMIIRRLTVRWRGRRGRGMP
jgi:hypothetical protein